MIRQGSQGSINFFYRNKMICSRPLGERSYGNYKEMRNKVMREAFEAGWSINSQIKFYRGFIKKIRYDKLLKQPTSDDWDVIACSILILIKLRDIDAHGDREGLLICPRKK